MTATLELTHKYCVTKQGPNTKHRAPQTMGAIINNESHSIRTTCLERAATEATWSLNAGY